MILDGHQVKWILFLDFIICKKHWYLYKEVIGLGDEWLNYQASVSDISFFILEQKHCIKEYRWSIARLSAINSLMRLITPTPACPFN